MPCLLQCRQAIAVIGGQQAKIAIFSVGDRRIFFRLSFSATKSLDANRKESLRLAELCGCWESGTRQIHPANFCLLLFVCVCQNTKRVHTMCSRIVQHQKKKKKKKKKERKKKKKTERKSPNNFCSSQIPRAKEYKQKQLKHPYVCSGLCVI